MFARFLKPTTACTHCGTAWDRHQADDFPSYVVIILLGHILVPIMAETMGRGIPMMVLMILWPGIALVLAAILIQPAKGGVIAFQWSRRMHGFEG